MHVLSSSLCHKRPAQDLPASLPCKRGKLGYRAQVAGSLVSRYRHRAPVAIFAAAAALDDLDIETPDIDADLRQFQEEAGAQFDDAEGIVSYGNDEEALQAAETGCCIVDQSGWGRLRVSGPDKLKFLHGQTTQDMLARHPGSGCLTVLTNAQGRSIELLTCYVQSSGVMLLVSPHMREAVHQRLDKYILYGDQVAIADVSSSCAMFTLTGPSAASVLQGLGASEDQLQQPQHSHSLLKLGDSPVMLAVGDQLAGQGYTLIADERVAADLWQSLTVKGAVPLGQQGWQHLRILAGRPQAGAELTDSFNPLEANLYHAVHVNKGCYMGQETLAKVSNRNAVNKQLWGVEVQGPAAAGDLVYKGDQKLGSISSATPRGSGTFALAYLRCKSQGQQQKVAGLQVECNGHPAIVTAVPFLCGEFPAGAAPSKEPAATEAEAAAAQEQSDKAAAEEAKQKRLQAMQDRLAAWQASQQ